MKEYIIIGGFMFNHKPLDFILNSLNNTRFFDINMLKNINTLDDIIDQLHQSIINTKNSNKINLIGYSMGGLIALKYAYEYPNQINKIVLINSSPNFIESNNWSGIKQQEFNRLIKRLSILNIDDFKRYFAQLASYPKPIDNKNYITYFSNTTDKKHYIMLLKIMQIVNLTNLIPKLKHKLLMIYSQKDVLIPWNKIEVPQIMLIDSTHVKLDLHSNLLTNIIKNIS